MLVHIREIQISLHSHTQAHKIRWKCMFVKLLLVVFVAILGYMNCIQHFTDYWNNSVCYVTLAY